MIKEGFENRFSKGDIVYWCEYTVHGLEIEYGIVEDQYSDGVYINKLTGRERRRVNGIPLEEFRSSFKCWKKKKLPKGWSYNTKLFEITEDPFTNEELALLKETSIDKPWKIKECYDKGILIEKSKKFDGNIEAKIDKDGYQVIPCHSMWKREEPKSFVILSNRVYSTYKEAKEEYDAEIAEYKRQAALTDEEWSLEQIEKDVCRFLYIRYAFRNQEEIDRYMTFFKELPRVEDIETRLFGGMLQWKYEKNKNWRSAVLPD